MKRKVLSSLALSLVVSLMLSACGVGLDDSLGPNPDRIMKNEKNRSDYERIKGSYEGTVSYSSGGRNPFPAKLDLYWVDEVERGNLDSDLQPAKRIVLRGRLQRLDVVGDSDNLILVGTYDSLNSKIVLKPDLEATSAQKCETGSRLPVSIEGSIGGSRIEATVTRDGRTWGRLEAQLKSRNVVQQATTNAEESFARLREMYSEIRGTYTGKIRRKNSRGEIYSEQVSVAIFTLESNEGNDERGNFCYRPRLHVEFRRERQGEFDRVSFNSVSFDPDLAELEAANYNVQGVSTVHIEARLNDGAMTGRLKAASGIWGEFELSRTSFETPSPADGEESYERQQRLKTYKEIIGTYIGRVYPHSRNTPNPVELVVYTVEVQQGTNEAGEPRYMPELRARYRRTDLDVGSATDRLMTVRYYIESGVRKLAMSVMGGNNGAIAGAGTLSISGSISGSQISGDISDHRGPQGTLQVTRTSR